jgi:transketolase
MITSKPSTYEEHLYSLIEASERYLVMTCENRSSIRGLPQRLGDRFIDTGISEQTLLGVAAGLAMRGRVPIVHGIGAFITMRGYEFIRTDIALQDLPVKIATTFTGLLSEGNGPTHQAVEDIALMRTMPNMVIFCPSDEEDLTMGLDLVLRCNAPVYIRLNHLSPVVEHLPYSAIGKAEIVREDAEGCDLTILAYGLLFKEALEAYCILHERGYKVRLVNMRFLQPLDETLISTIATDSRLIVTVEDHYIHGGLYTALCEVLLRKGIAKSVLPICLHKKWFAAAPLEELLSFEGLRGRDIASKIISIGGINAK